MHRPLFAAALVLCLMAAPALAVAQECSPARAESLSRAASISFNRYYFSVPDDSNRCGHLRAALDRRAELLALAERCSTDADDIRIELQKLEALGNVDGNCS